MNKNNIAWALVACAALGASVARAEHKGVPHDAAHAHAHGHHAHEHDTAHEPHMAQPDATTATLKQTDAIAEALTAGGEPIVVDVLGVVCDFCAKAMNKTFGKRDEVAAVHVDLDEKTLSLVLNDGAQLADNDIEKLVKRSGYRLSAIRRGAQALGATTQ